MIWHSIAAMKAPWPSWLLPEGPLPCSLRENTTRIFLFGVHQPGTEPVEVRAVEEPDASGRGMGLLRRARTWTYGYLTELGAPSG